MLTHLVVREKGTYSFFGIGENYKELITREGAEAENSKGICEGAKGIGKKSKGMGEEVKGIDEKSKGMDEESKGCGFKSTTNNPSTKDSSTKINKNLLLEKSAFEIIEYLNLKTGKNFRSSTKITIRLIKARINEGFTIEDFKTVIDNMKYKWTGTKFQQYLVPTTLFGNKFETYLNQERKPEKESDGKFKRGNMVLSDERNKAELKEKLKNIVLKEDM